MKKFVLLIAFGLLIASQVLGQDAPALFTVHEDVVKPSMSGKYREAAKKLKAACEQYKVNVTWSSVSFDDNVFHHLLPIKGFADLEKNPFAELETKMGKEAMGKIWAEFDPCVETQRDFVVMQLPQYSYLTPVVGESSLNLAFWYPEPGKAAEAEAVLADWKKLYVAKKIPSGYAVYKIVYGNEPDYVIVTSGKNRVDLATKQQQEWELGGEDGGKLYARTMAITRKITDRRADVLPDISYSPAPATTATK